MHCNHASGGICFGVTWRVPHFGERWLCRGCAVKKWLGITSACLTLVCLLHKVSCCKLKVIERLLLCWKIHMGTSSISFRQSVKAPVQNLVAPMTTKNRTGVKRRHLEECLNAHGIILCFLMRIGRNLWQWLTAKNMPCVNMSCISPSEDLKSTV